jgi:hypothetical protein
VTRVIKVGGRPQSDPRLAGAIASGWNRGDGQIVLVHGGGDEVSTLQSAFGETSRFVDFALLDLPDCGLFKSFGRFFQNIVRQVKRRDRKPV